jgi:hypothetical protein
VVDEVSATWTSTDASHLTDIFNKLPSKLYLAGTANSTGALEAGAFTGNFPGSVGSVDGNVGGSMLGDLQGVVIGAGGSGPFGIGVNANVLQIEGVDATDAIDARISARLAAYGVSTYAGGDTPGTGTLLTRIGTPAASVSADIAAVKADTGNLVTRITSTLFSGITSLGQWLGLIAGKQAGNSTARTELRATGAGSGTFDETADSLEALRARGDAAWATATGFSTLTAADVDAQLSDTHGDGSWEGGGGGGIDVYSKAYLYGPMIVGSDGSYTFLDADDQATHVLKFGRRAAPGGRTVIKDPP